MQKNKNIEFFGFSKNKKMFSEMVQTNRFFQKWFKPRAKLQSEQDIEKKRDTKSQNKQNKEQNIRTTMQRERRESKTSKATNKQARATQNNEN